MFHGFAIARWIQPKRTILHHLLNRLQVSHFLQNWVVLQWFNFPGNLRTQRNFNRLSIHLGKSIEALPVAKRPLHNMLCLVAILIGLPPLAVSPCFSPCWSPLNCQQGGSDRGLQVPPWSADPIFGALFRCSDSCPPPALLLRTNQGP